eukprot:UN34396
MEKFMLMLGFKRNTEELRITAVDKKRFEKAVAELKVVLEFIENIRLNIKDCDPKRRYVVVRSFVNFFDRKIPLPKSFDEGSAIKKTCEGFMKGETIQIGVEVLRFHEKVLWARHPLGPFFKDLKLKLVDEKYVARVVDVSGK